MMGAVVVEIHQAHSFEEERHFNVTRKERVIERGLVVGEAVQHSENEGSEHVERH